MAKNDDKYTDPELRTEIKEEVQAGDKGGNPGQWSARKAQMMAAKYKEEMHKRGEEPYTTDKSEKSESQKHLSNWTDEEWQTSDGKAEAKQEDGSMKRYLPKKAWEEMSESEKRETDEKKMKEGKGKQFVSNTDKAKNARKHASKADGDETNADNAEAKKAASNGRNEDEDTEMEEDSVSEASDADEISDEDPLADDDDAEYEVDEDSKQAAKKLKTNGGAKRVTRSMTEGDDEKKRKSAPSKGSDTESASKEESKTQPKKDTKSKPKSKKAEENGSNGGSNTAKNDSDSKRDSKKDSEDEDGNDGEQQQNGQGDKESPPSRGENGDGEHGQPGSASRLPKQGQHVFWRSSPGWIEGTVIEIVRTNKSVDGIQANGSESDPRIALKSSSSGKTAVHKPSAVYF